jgi:hypothetical protein
VWNYTAAYVHRETVTNYIHVQTHTHTHTHTHTQKEYHFINGELHSQEIPRIVKFGAHSKTGVTFKSMKFKRKTSLNLSQFICIVKYICMIFNEKLFKIKCDIYLNCQFFVNFFIRHKQVIKFSFKLDAPLHIWIQLKHFIRKLSG